MRYSDQYWGDVGLVCDAIPGWEDLRGKHVLITGATGMICSAVAEVLFFLNKNRDARITIDLAGRSPEKMAARFPDFREGTDYHFIRFDATKEAVFERPADYIIYGAGYGDPKGILSSPVSVIRANISGLDAALDCAARQKARLLYISSSEVYGQHDGTRPFREDDYGFVDILQVRACYPCAKRLGENLCIAYHEEYGLETVIIRPGHIYGPTITAADSRASAQFSRCAKEGKSIVLKSDGAQLRSYCYTLDCASAILTALLRGESANAYNISNPDSVVSIRDLAQAFSDASGQPLCFENATDREKKSYNFMSNSSLDAGKLLGLGWHACFPLEEGVRRTLQYL